MKDAIQALLQSGAVLQNQATFNASVRRRFGLTDSRMLDDVLESNPTLSRLATVLEKALLEKRRARHSATCLFEENLEEHAINIRSTQSAAGSEEPVRVELAVVSGGSGAPFVGVHGQGLGFVIQFRYCPTCGCSLRMLPEE